MTIRRFFLLLALAACVPSPGWAASPFGAQPPRVEPGPGRIATDPDRWLPWRVFTWREGLKPGAPALAQDSQGYIWADGPVRYNGRTWQRMEVPGEEGPVAIWSTLAGRDGSLWLGKVSGGLLRLRKGVWTRVEKGLPAGTVQDMVEDGEGNLWAATLAGLARCQDGRCAEVSALRGRNIRKLVLTRAEDGRPAFWIGTSLGLLRFEGIDGPSPTLSPLFADPAVLPDVSIRGLAETVSQDGERSLWVGTDGGLARLRAGRWTRYDAATGFPPGPVIKLLATRSAAGRPIVWAGSFHSGLIRLDDDGRWRLFDNRSGLPANYVYNLLATSSGTGEPTIWVATPGGLARLEREQWKTIDSRSGLPDDIAVGMGEATFPDGLRTYWIGTVGGMARFVDGRWERYGPNNEAVLTVASDEPPGKDGSFWMGTVDGLRRYHGGAWTNVNSRNSPLPHDWVLTLISTPSPGGPALWVGTSQGLARFQQGLWTVFRAGKAPQGELPGSAVRALGWQPLPSGEVLWIGTDNGLARFSGGRLEAVPVPCLPHPMIFTVHPRMEPDGTGWLWIGTQRGVARARLDRDGRFQGPCQALSDRTNPPLAHASIAQVQTDAWGRAYLFTDWGVNRLTLGPQGLAGARIESFDAGDGLPGMEFNRASFRDHLGRIWAGAAGGAAILDPAPPERASAPRRAAPLLFERIVVQGRERALANGTELPHDQDNLEFQYALLSYRREQMTRYQTQLVGLEDSPGPWTREARVVYNRLPGGEYTFRVWGKDGAGTVSGPIETRFRVLPPPWLTGWAIALYVAVLVGLGYSLTQWRVKTLARRAAALEAQIAERTRELEAANSKLELASLTDPLTGLSNRRFLTLNIEPDLRQAVRNVLGTVPPRERNADLIFYFLDVDHFKQLNDRDGHAAGDTVLVELARRLRDAARTTDAVVRWGGEEFLIVSRWTDRRAGDVLAQRLLEAVAGAPFEITRTTGTGTLVSMTCSVGWAPFPWIQDDPDAVHWEHVLSLADRALYLAKREGRNRAVGVLPGQDSVSVPDGSLDELDGSCVELVRSAGPSSPHSDVTRQPDTVVVAFPQRWNL